METGSHDAVSPLRPFQLTQSFRNTAFGPVSRVNFHCTAIFGEIVCVRHLIGASGRSAPIERLPPRGSIQGVCHEGLEEEGVCQAPPRQPWERPSPDPGHLPPFANALRDRLSGDADIDADASSGRNIVGRWMIHSAFSSAYRRFYGRLIHRCHTDQPGQQWDMSPDWRRQES
jgi:hypothetical protein